MLQAHIAKMLSGIEMCDNPRKIVQRLPDQHAVLKALHLARNERSFPSWLCLLKEHFSLLVYGLGSKRTLLEKFATSTLGDGGVLAVDGLAAGMTAHHILAKAGSMLRFSGHKRSSGAVAILKHIEDQPAEPPLYIILHNIDGEELRTAQAQELLSKLAACPCIHVAASMDHLNAPLLWDRQTASRFNWAYVAAHTYLPYISETQHVPSLLVARREVQRTAGALMVLRSLPQNARHIFKVLAGPQLDEDDEDKGLTFARLFRMCRERFLVTNELALRAHLTEFRDHQLIQTRRGQDGTDFMFVPMAPEALSQLLQDMEAG